MDETVSEIIKRGRQYAENLEKEREREERERIAKNIQEWDDYIRGIFIFTVDNFDKLHKYIELPKRDDRVQCGEPTITTLTIRIPDIAPIRFEIERFCPTGNNWHIVSGYRLPTIFWNGGNANYSFQDERFIENLDYAIFLASELAKKMPK